METRPDLTPNEYAAMAAGGLDPNTDPKPTPPSPDVDGMTATEYALWQDQQRVRTATVDAPHTKEGTGDEPPTETPAPNEPASDEPPVVVNQGDAPAGDGSNLTATPEEPTGKRSAKKA